jgi:hypothetical protein
MFEMNKPANRSKRVLLVVFVVVAATGIGLGIFFGRARALAEQRCAADCALLGKRGVMKPSERWWQAVGMRSAGPESCGCE